MERTPPASWRLMRSHLSITSSPVSSFFSVTEYVGMAPDEFFGDFLADGIGVEIAVATCDIGMEDDLYHDISEFLFEGIRIGILDRFQHFVSLFEQVWAQRLVRLLGIPWATARVSERTDGVDQELEPVLVIFSGWNLHIHGLRNLYRRKLLRL